MDNHKRIVFTPSEAVTKRGPLATEMITCPQCGNQSGVFVVVLSQVSNVVADETEYDRLMIERWVCINCRHIWSEAYAVKPPTRGIVKPLFSAYNTDEGE